MGEARPYTPETLAEYWGCSANHVRNLVKSGELRGYRLGRRLIRIKPEAVEEYEQCQTRELDGSMGDTSSRGGKVESGGVSVLRAYQPRTRSEKRST